MRSAAAVLSLVSATLLLCSAQYVAANNPAVVSARCDPRGMIPQGSPYWIHLGYLLKILTDNAPYSTPYSFKTRVGGGDAPAFGKAYRQPSSTPAQCESCLRLLSYNICHVCNSALHAHVEYADCSIRYKGYYF